MRFYKTALNLVIVDFTSLEEAINKDYYQQLNVWGVLEESLKEKEKTRLRLYYYLKYMLTAVKENSNNRNTVFYVTNATAKPYLDIITKFHPLIVHYGNLNFNWIENNNGEAREILESVKTTRFNFDYSKYPKQKAEIFYKKYKIQPLS